MQMHNEPNDETRITPARILPNSLLVAVQFIKAVFILCNALISLYGLKTRNNYLIYA